ncbi:MAG: glycoside hydrolase family 5 protein [Methylococcales bacterium]|nr:glycoside hydrolase family 5 protein [Methylococcales bacterium]
MQVKGNNRGQKLRGVNLGGWLVLEKWMTPSLFAGLGAEDETAWCLEMGAQAEPVLRRHRVTFIGREDFAWLASVGINAVRIPLGHWLFAADYPYHPRYGENRHPYVQGGDAVLAQAFDWAEEYGLQVVLDLHAAPGCQNGFDNGGIKDVCDWHSKPEYLEYSLTVLETLARRFHGSPALHGIEVLNEPRGDIETGLLKQYTAEAYRRIRKYCRAGDVAVIFHDGFRPYRQYSGFLQAPAFDNVIFDIHRYQCFEQKDIDTDIYGHLIKAAGEWRQEADELIARAGRCTYVGEWSLGLNPRILDLWRQGWLDCRLQPMDSFQQGVAYRGYAAAQLLSFEKYLGWFFWSYKTETMPQWSFRDCVVNGWLPADFSG